MRVLTIGLAVSAMCSCSGESVRTLPAQTEVCRLAADATTSGPHAAVCRRIAQRWTLLTGELPAPGAVRLEARTGFDGDAAADGWSLAWPAPPRGRDIRPADLNDYIPHEAAHKVFASHVFPQYSAAGPTRYASVLPDWIDEAPAIWAESAASRTRRLHAVRGTTPSLARLVTMAHPVLARGTARGGARGGAAEFELIQRMVEPPCERCTWLHDSLRSKFRVTDVRLKPDGSADTVVAFVDRDPDNLSALEEKQFYPLAYSLLRFVHASGGAAAVRQLLTRYRANPRAGAEVLVGLPGLPASMEAFASAWQRFLNNPPAETE